MNTVTPEIYNFIESYQYRVFPLLHGNSRKVKRAFKSLISDISKAGKKPMRWKFPGSDEWTTYGTIWKECIVMELGLRRIIDNLRNEFTEEELSELIGHLWRLSLWMNEQPEARGNMASCWQSSYRL